MRYIITYYRADGTSDNMQTVVNGDQALTVMLTVLLNTGHVIISVE